MLKLLTCPRGHYWEAPVEDGAESPLEVCPECGDAAESMPVLELAPPEAAPTAPSEPPPPPPLRDRGGRPVVAGYEILEDLGKGPTGVRHYKARQVLVNRIVILKAVFAKEDPGQTAWGSLRGEAAALGKLSHPNIVQVLEVGERDRQLFYNAVEYVDGPNLGDAVGGKSLSFRQAAALVETLARAVHQAHEKNLLHRNLKPASILLLHGDLHLPKITDFGLARRPVEGDPTDVELQGGLPCYLSPEQAWGRAREIGPATDVYALGAILYELVAGRPPFSGETAGQTLDAIQCREPKPLARFRSRVPSDLDAVCRKCLAKSPRRRYVSALDLADDLRRFADGYPIRGRQVGPGERLGKWLRRNLRTVALVLLGLWAVLSVLLLAMSDGPERAPNLQEQHFRSEANRLQNELAQSRRRGAADSYLRNLLLAEREGREGDPARARELLDRCPADQRQWEWYFLSNRLRQEGGGISVFTAGSTVNSVDFSPDGRYLAVGGGSEGADKPEGGEGEVAVWDLTTKEKIWRAAVPAPVRAVAFSPDGERLALVGSSSKRKDSEVQARWARFTGQVVYTRAYPGSQLTALAFSTDRARLFVAGGDGLVRTLRADDGTPLQQQQVAFRRARPRGGMHTQLAPLGQHPDNLALVSPDGGQVVVLPNLAGVAPVDLRGHENTVIRAIAYDPQHELLATAAEDQSIRLWSRYPYQTVKVLRGHRSGVTGVSFGDGGKRLASCGADGTVRIWDPEQGQLLLTMPGYPLASGVRFHPAPLQVGLMVGQVHINPPPEESVDHLAVIHGKKVTVTAPTAAPAGRAQPPGFLK